MFKNLTAKSDKEFYLGNAESCLRDLPKGQSANEKSIRRFYIKRAEKYISEFIKNERKTFDIDTNKSDNKSYSIFE